MKSLSLAVFTLILTTFLFAPSAVQGQSEDELRDILDSFRLNALQFQVTILGFEKSHLKRQSSSLDDFEKQLERMKKLPNLLTNKEIPKEEGRLLLKHMERFYGFMVIFLPEHHQKEIVPLLFISLRNEPLPQKPTKLQQRLIKAGGGKFEGILSEATKIISEDRKSLEGKLKEVSAKIADLEKEIKKISMKKKTA